MLDANQVWEIQQAIDWVKKLAPFKPTWIEEPTSPDDILGNATIAKALKPLGIAVASGEMCANRIMFKQFLQADAMQICQIDSARIGGVNEILAVYLMAKKLGGEWTIRFYSHFRPNVLREQTRFIKFIFRWHLRHVFSDGSEWQTLKL